MRTTAGSIGLALAALLVATSSHAEWGDQIASNYKRSCVDSCKKKTNGSEGCVEYCRCSQEETEKQFPDYPRLEREIMVEKLAPRIASFQAIQDSCNTRVFGRPADKLKFE